MKEIIDLLKTGQHSIDLKGKIQSSTAESRAMEGLLLRLIAVHSVMAEFVNKPTKETREEIHLEWVKFVNFASSLDSHTFLFLWYILTQSKTAEIAYWHKGETYRFPKLYLVASVRIGVQIITSLSGLANSFAMYSDAWSATESGKSQPFSVRAEAVKKLVYIVLLGIAPDFQSSDECVKFLEDFKQFEQSEEKPQEKRTWKDKLKRLFTWKRGTI